MLHRHCAGRNEQSVVFEIDAAGYGHFNARERVANGVSIVRDAFKPPNEDGDLRCVLIRLSDEMQQRRSRMLHLRAKFRVFVQIPDKCFQNRFKHCVSILVRRYEPWSPNCSRALAHRLQSVMRHAATTLDKRQQWPQSPLDRISRPNFVPSSSPPLSSCHRPCQTFQANTDMVRVEPDDCLTHMDVCVMGNTRPV